MTLRAPARLLGGLLLAAPAALPAQALVVVDPAGPVRTVTEALARVAPGGRINVRAGNYSEPVIRVAVPVTIVGDSGAVFVGGDHEIFVVTADDVTFRGLTLRHVEPSYVEDRAAILFDSVANCVVEDSRLEGTFFGIYLSRSRGCRISRNVVQGTSTAEMSAGNAIHLFHSRDVTVDGNRVTGHRDGIYLEFAEDARVIGNLSTGNLRYGLHFMFSHRCEYRDNRFVNNGAGVAVMYTRSMLMQGNTFADNWGAASYGLLLKEIRDSRILGNSFRENTVGMYLEGSARNEVTGNTFEANGWAVRVLADAEGNRFARNVFLRNSFDVSTNSRSNVSTFRGNYWDHYEGYDLDHDGFGDVPFHPVRLFSLLVAQHEPSLILLRSFFVDLLDAAERVMPVLTPETLRDDRPLMRVPA
ncbi:MAG TPA: nitrous oxide reductase family maturation protein NosD [Gemmatimonadales bacterium]|nr:nitrous oxide reductase family maturation protein NosD [Gemmatimonadales bacterium]HRZ08439.1 nitrous oxide reductase family maturation protein NosD [Gemmatimonadales bacterium]